jgi:protein-ribulosamine 3-kinase
MPGSITSILQPILSRSAGLPATEELFYRPVGGGSINDSYQVSTRNNKKWFVKFNQDDPQNPRFPGLFAKEANGLGILASQQLIRTPTVIACEESAGCQVLVLEWIDQQAPPNERMQQPPEAFWRLFGERLAQLHRVTRDRFGLEENNYMGALPQDNRPLNRPDAPPDAENPPRSSWADFFIQRRLQPQVRLAVDYGLLDSTALRQFDHVYPALPGIFNDDEPPALLHGDLWSGNFLCDNNQQPVLIDPAVYYGHRSMDLAMTTLFGGFEPGFYESYAYHYPFPPNYHEQWEIANLYPLLVHLNLFGKSYLGNILHTIQRF